MNYQMNKNKKNLNTFTASSKRTFDICRKKYFYRVIKNLVPLKRQSYFAFGSVVHEWLEEWHKNKDHNECQNIIDKAYSNREADIIEKQNWHYQTAMLRAYINEYIEDDFVVIALEKEFNGDVVNPKTHKKSRSFKARGKVDGIVLRGNDYYLLEHKTASSTTGDSLERLWSDFQIHMYAIYVREVLGLPVKGVIYNILQKPKLTQSIGETEEQYQVRLKELIAKSKTGKSSAKRKMPESDVAFQERLVDWYKKGQRLIREEILFDYNTLKNVERQIWDATQEILLAKRYNRWTQNTHQCFAMGRCEY